jgi:hypothetical protein
MTPQELKRRYDAGELDFRCADLRGADLQGADLGRARLQGANLQGADLRDANLRGANLSFARLQDADLQGANLRGASLCCANLRGANLQNANLQNTCLAPDAVCAALPTDEDITQAGLELHGDRVYGWRTKTSRHCGSTVYEVGKEYEAPWFSADPTASCHPGLYLAGKEWLEENYPDVEVVRVYCLRSELVHAGTEPDDKWRARRLWVVAADEP